MRWLITGASGVLGRYLLRELTGEPVVAWSHTNLASPFVPVDLSDSDAVSAAFRAAKPEIIFHCAAMSRVDACHRDPAMANRINAMGTALLCELAARVRLVFISTDMIFDGERAPYREADAPTPLSTYGRSKAAGELPVQQHSNGVVARSSLLFGPSSQPTFFSQMLKSLAVGHSMTLFTDEWRTPLGLSAAARMLVGLARSDFIGTIHLGGLERMSRWDMGQRLARHLRLTDANLIPGKRNEAGGVEPRPRDLSLDTGLWRATFPSHRIPSYDESLADMLNDNRGHTRG